MHYTAWLLIPSVIGFFFYFGVLLMWDSNEKGYFEHQNTIHYSYYAIIVAIWSVCFIESWKRREALLGDRWLVRDSSQMQNVYTNKQFKASTMIDTELGAPVQIAKPNRNRWLLGVPLSLLFIGSVVVIYWIFH